MLEVKDCGISGTLPLAWSGMRSLISLDAGNNPQLGGPLAAVSGLSSVVDVWLRNCSFSGAVPADWAQLPDLFRVDLGHNSLEGGLPDAWASAPGLQLLTINNNRLSGTLVGSDPGAGASGAAAASRRGCVCSGCCRLAHALEKYAP